MTRNVSARTCCTWQHRAPHFPPPWHTVRLGPLRWCCSTILMSVLASSSPTFVSVQVVSSTRIILFVRIGSLPPGQRQQLKIVAVDTGAGAVQLNPEDGGVVIGTLSRLRGRTFALPVKHQEARKQDALRHNLVRLVLRGFAPSFCVFTQFADANLAGNLFTFGRGASGFRCQWGANGFRWVREGLPQSSAQTNITLGLRVVRVNTRCSSHGVSIHECTCLKCIDMAMRCDKLEPSCTRKPVNVNSFVLAHASP